MGLDMYLSAKRFFWTSGKRQEKMKATLIKRLFPEVKNYKINYLIVEVGYWRKANHIHKWFVDNIQKGKDDCGEYHVERRELEDLRETCIEVLESLENQKTKKIKVKQHGFTDTVDVFENTETAEDELPTERGFFFGGIQYDEWYVNDLKDTIKIIDKCLKLSDEWDFEYGSSW